MGFDRKQLKEQPKPLYSFIGKRIEVVEAITLPVSFDTPKNPCTEYITFDVVDMTYPYNATRTCTFYKSSQSITKLNL
jgi:hypothetical protein